MDESRAWLEQAKSDRAAAERFCGDKDDTQWCHAIAKCQQAVEKAVKAIVAAAPRVGISTKKIGYDHTVKHFVSGLIHSPRGKKNSIVNRLSILFNEETRASIDSLEELIPKQPPPGTPHRRNTEYPFDTPHNGWTCPAAHGVFLSSEVQRFRKLSYRIVDGADKIVEAIRLAPR